MNRYIDYSVLLLFFLLIHSGCDKSSLNVPDYISFVRDESSGLKKAIKHDDVEFSVQLETPEYLALKELKGTKITRKLLQNEMEKFKDYLYLDFSILLTDLSKPLLDKNDTVNYNRKFNYLSFGMQSNIYFIVKSDTLHCLMYQFVSNQGISPEYHFEMIFDKLDEEDLHSPAKFYFIDSVMGFGEVSIPFNLQALTKVPKLKL